MKKILLILLILASSLVAELKHQYLSQKMIDSKIPIVDIRTPGEWKETGLVKNSIPIMFFSETGAYDVNDFLAKLNRAVDTKKPFALICRTGSRTGMVTEFLSSQLHYNVVDVKGGIVLARPNNIALVPYK